MQRIDLDYNVQGKKWPAIASFCLLLGALLSCALVAQHYQQLSVQKAALVAQHTPESGLNTQSVSPDLAASTAAAHQLADKLNTHWLSALNALETVHAEHPAIMLLNIHPQLPQAKLSLTGEADGFEAITQYIQALEHHPQFNDVALHRQSNDDDRPGTIVFIINMGWQQ